MNKHIQTPAKEHGLRKAERWRLALGAFVVLGSVVVAIAPDDDAENAPAREPPAPTAPDIARPTDISPAGPLPSAAMKDASAPFQSEKVRTPDPHDGRYKGVTSIGEKFHMDAKGRLVQNEKTRLHLDALVTLLEPDTLYEIVEHEVRDLPPEAAAQVRELVERYKIYIQNEHNLVPPGRTPMSDDEALAQLDALRDLRIAHFGAETAAALYGEEEQLNREQIGLMRSERN